MCVDFDKIDLKRVANVMGKIPKKTFDPIFGEKPVLARVWTNYPQKHGDIISESLLEFVRATPDWEGQIEFKFASGKKKKKYFFDNLVFNKKLNIAIVIECKRNLDLQPNDAINRIKDYKSITNLKKLNILQEIGLNTVKGDVFFLVFDAYGPRKKNFDFPTIYPEDLGKIFGKCVLSVWQGFEKNFLNELTKIGFKAEDSFIRRVSDYDSLEVLSNHRQQKEELCVISNTEIRSRIRDISLRMSHMTKLNEFVEKLREENPDEYVPHFDPLDGGIEAEILFLLEKPGPKTFPPKGSGYISQDNDDPTAKNTKKMLSDAGIDRKKIALWNTISTWNGTIEITSSEREKSSEQLIELLKVLKKLKTIVLVGRNAQKMKEHLDTSKFNVVPSFHTSNKVKNNDKEKWNSILSSFKEAARLTGL